jgi:hypothetical protein
MKALMPLLRDPSYEYWPQIGDALIERARSISASYFLRHTDADVHLSIDSDIVEFEKDAIDKMCEQAEKYDIVGAVYICRSTSRTFPATFFNDGGAIEFAFDPTPKPVMWVATGCLAVHRRVFEKMAETMPLLHERDGERAFHNFYHSMEYDTEEMGRILLSEDYAFSQRAKDLGFTCYINPAVRVGHMGPYAYRLEDMAQKLLEPQPLKLERRGVHWRIECAMNEETPESMGRIPEGESEAIRKKFGESRPQRRAREKREKRLASVS